MWMVSTRLGARGASAVVLFLAACGGGPGLREAKYEHDGELDWEKCHQGDDAACLIAGQRLCRRDEHGKSRTTAFDPMRASKGKYYQDCAAGALALREACNRGHAASCDLAASVSQSEEVSVERGRGIWRTAVEFARKGCALNNLASCKRIAHCGKMLRDTDVEMEGLKESCRVGGGEHCERLERVIKAGGPKRGSRGDATTPSGPVQYSNWSCWSKQAWTHPPPPEDPRAMATGCYKFHVLKVANAKGASDVAARLAEKWGTPPNVSWHCDAAEVPPLISEFGRMAFECPDNANWVTQGREDL